MKEFAPFKFLLLFILILNLSTSQAQCSYLGTPLTQSGATVTFCIDNVATVNTTSVNAGQYVLVNVVKGFNYTFSVGNVFGLFNENLTILNADTNVLAAPTAYNSGIFGTSITWTSTLSGQVKVLLSKGSCLNDNATGGTVTTTLNSIGNTQDSQTAAGTNTWIGHVYNWTGTAPPGGTSPSSASVAAPFVDANYVGNYSIASETIAETFGGNGVCLPVNSNGANRVNVYTEQYAVRYRMRSTRSGCFMVTCSGDDGVRLYVDGVKVFDQWNEQSPTTYLNLLVYLNGNSDIVFDYYENGGGNIANFNLTPFDPTTNSLTATNTSVFSGTAPGIITGTNYVYNGTIVNPAISYQWQSSTDNVNFTNIVGATTKDYTPTAITTSSTIITYYRRVVRASATNASTCAYNSNVIAITTLAYEPCSYSSSLTQVGSLNTFCVDNSNIVYSPTVNAGQFLLVNVVKGFTYNFSVGNVFFTDTESLSILDAATNNSVGLSGFAYGNTGASLTWTASLSGQIKLVLAKGACLFDNTAGGMITMTLNSVGNTQDSQTAFGTDNWVGHVYNWTGAAPPGGTSPSSPTATGAFISSNYVGYYNVPTESFGEGFGGDYTCFPVLTNGVNRVNINTEQYAVRYRMRSTKTGCYIVNFSGDDGIRIYVDGVKIFDEWIVQAPTGYGNVLVYLNGNSDIVFDYFENWGLNVANFSLTPFVPSSNTVTPPATVNVCNGVSPGLLNGSSYVYNGATVNPTITFQWQSSTDNINFTNIAGATTEDYTPAGITATTSNVITYYRRIVTAAATNASGCSSTSNAIAIVTSPTGIPATPASISGLVSQCVSATGQVYSCTTVTNAVTYNWTVPAGWTITAGAGTNSITVTTGTTGQNGNISVTASNGCGTSTAKSLAVTVSSVAVAGTVSANQTICTGLQPANITLTGSTGSIQWQSSTNNTSFTNISGATSATLTSATIGVLTATTYYRAVLTVGVCSTINSAIVTVNPNTAITSQPLTTQTVCLNGTSTSLSVVVTGVSLTYQWYSNTTNATTGGTLISGATSATYTPLTNTTVTKYYYCTVTGSCGASVTSNTGGVIISPYSVAGTVSANQNICSGTQPANITLTGNTGTVQWQSSPDNVTFTNIVGATSTTLANLTMGTLTTTTYYRAVVTNSVCSSVNSNVVTVNVSNYPGNFGNALNLDGTNDYVVTPNIASSMTTNDVTVEIWFKANAAGVIVDELGQAVLNGNWHDSQIEILSTGEVRVRVWFLNIISLGFVTFGSWNHAVVRYNSSTSTLDGLLNGIASTTTTVGTRSKSTASGFGYHYAFGGTDNTNMGSGAYFNGSIDEVRVWSTARTNAQIQTYMNTELLGNELGLVTYYNFNQGIANGTNTTLTAVYDKSNNLYNGTLTNFALAGTTSNYVDGNSFSIAPITGITNGCIGTTSQLSDATFGGVWSSSNPAVATISSTTGSVTTVNSGTTTITYTLTSNVGCSGSVNKVFTVNPNLPAIVSIVATATTICSGTSVTFTATPTNGGATPTYQWKLNGANISGQTASTYSTTTIANNDVVTVVMTSNASPCLIGSPITSNAITITLSNYPGNFGNSLNFDGTNDTVSTPITMSASYTKEAWIYLPTIDGNAHNIISAAGTSAGSYLFIWNSGKLTAGQNATTFIDVQDTATLNINTWYHVAVTYDAPSTTMKLYKNGLLVATNNSVAPVTINFTTALGSYTGSAFFQGTIDEVRVWNSARTIGQIQASMNTELLGNETGLLAYYNFNQGIANGTNTLLTTVYDKSNNLYNGTLTNFALAGTSSNYVDGNSFSIAPITGITNGCIGTTSQLSDATFGGVWSSSNPTVATINSTSGLVTALSSGTTTITYTLTSNVSCSSSVNKVFTVNPNLPASVSIVATATTICSGTSVTFTATPINGITSPTYQWKLNGANISGQNASIFTTTTLINNDAISVVMVSNTSPCFTSSPATSNSITVSVTPVSVAGTVSANQTICSGTQPTNITLTGNTGTVQWQSSTNGSTFTNISGATTTTLTSAQMGSLTATSYYRAVVTNGICSTSISGVVMVSVSGITTIATNTSTQTICGTSIATLSANAPTVGVGSWSVVSGPSLLTTQFSSVSNPFATFTPAGGVGSYVVRWAITNGTCGTSTADATITVGTLPTASITVNNSPVCIGANAIFTLTGTAGAIVTYNFNGGPNTITTLIAGTATVSIIASVPQTLNLVSISNGSCNQSLSGSSTVTLGTNQWFGGNGDWNVANNWTCGFIPTIDTPVVINSGVVTIPADAFSSSLAINGTATITVNSGFDLTVDNILNVASTARLTVKDNANLMQNGTVNNNIGTTVTINKNSSALFRLDYELWSSPTSGTQTLANFSSQTSANRFYTYTSATDYYTANNGAIPFDVARGYLIRMPNNWIPWSATATPAAWLGSFNGKPNNGNISIGISTAGNGYNAVGNPYPSQLNVVDFLNYNIDNYNNIEGTLWFWRKTNDYTNPVSYSTCTLVGSAVQNRHQYIDDKKISVGQGFFVKAKSGASTVYFTNTMRISSNVNQFFKTATTVDRFWLELKNADGVSFGQKLIAYVPDATLDYDTKYDGLFINDTPTALTSMAGDKEVVIQARPIFDTQDVVPMLFKTNTAGNYVIILNQFEGVFATGQEILLRDNLTGTIHNMNTEGNYTFSSEIGTFNSRFDVIYQSSALGNNSNSFTENNVTVYDNNKVIHVKSNIEITKVKVFDIRGRLIIEKNSINSTEVKIDASRIPNQVLLVQITSNEGIVVTKKVMN